VTDAVLDALTRCDIVVVKFFPCLRIVVVVVILLDNLLVRLLVEPREANKVNRCNFDVPLVEEHDHLRTRISQENCCVARKITHFVAKSVPHIILTERVRFWNGDWLRELPVSLKAPTFLEYVARSPVGQLEPATPWTDTGIIETCLDLGNFVVLSGDGTRVAVGVGPDALVVRVLPLVGG
jgi:hypothetical protein